MEKEIGMRILNVKKTTALLLSASMVLGSSFVVQADDSDKSDSGEKVKLTALFSGSDATRSVEDMEWLKKVEEEANVEIEWTQIRQSDWSETKGTMLGSGDVPDIMIGAENFQKTDFSTYKGLFKDMSSLLEDAPNIQKMFEEQPEVRYIAEEDDGAIYGIPKFQRYSPQSWLRQYINKTWLDKLGLDMPETLDDFYEVLKAFKEQDPNGNGKADEVGWAFHADPSTVMLPYVFMTSYGVSFDALKGSLGYYVKDGEVKNFLDSDEFKEVTKFINKLYQDGLIYSASFTQDWSATTALYRKGEDAGEATVGFIMNYSKTDVVGEKLEDQYVPMPPLKVSDDSDYEPTWTNEYDALNYKPIVVTMSEKCENPEAAMRFIDALYGEEASVESMYGDIGTMVQKNDDGSYKVLSGTEAGDTNSLGGAAYRGTQTMCDYGPGYMSKDLKIELPDDVAAVKEDQEAFDKVLEATVDSDGDILHQNFLKFTSDELSQLSLIHSNIEYVAKSQFTDFVVNGGIDEGWDSYIQNLEGTGYKDGIQIYQRAYDSYKESVSESK